MTELVETLLSISRIEIGALAIDKKRVNVPKIIDDILPELETVRKQNNVKIIRQYDGNLTDIEGDPRLLRIVIQNLISNALKYARQDGTVEIRLKESWSERSIIITDDGIGIPENEQDKIFTKLFRASNARTLEGNDGTGLGLYLVKIYRQLAVTANIAPRDVGDHLLMGGAEAEIALVAVLEAQQFRAVLLPARGFLPQLRRLHRRHQQFDGAGAIHFLAHDIGDFIQYHQSQW